MRCALMNLTFPVNLLAAQLLMLPLRFDGEHNADEQYVEEGD